MDGLFLWLGMLLLFFFFKEGIGCEHVSFFWEHSISLGRQTSSPGWGAPNTLAATCLELLGGLQPGCQGFSLHICTLEFKGCVFLKDGSGGVRDDDLV